MAREHELYRPYIERLDEQFPLSPEFITVMEAATFIGRKRAYVYEHFKEIIDGGLISKTKLAHALCYPKPRKRRR